MIQPGIRKHQEERKGHARNKKEMIVGRWRDRRLLVHEPI
jgi:hypothetical protein